MSISVCAYVCIYAFMYVCVYVRTYIRVCVCVCVCVCEFINRNINSLVYVLPQVVHAASGSLFVPHESVQLPKILKQSSYSYG